MRAERLSLKGSVFQLECENSSLRTKLERAEERERELLKAAGVERNRWSGMDQDQVEVSWSPLGLLVEEADLLLPDRRCGARWRTQSRLSIRLA
jgi:hypothetical protein